MSKLPIIGGFYKWNLDQYLAFSYDIAVTFVEAHEEANDLIRGVIKSELFVNIIIKEA